MRREVEEFIETLDEMLADTRYQFAWDTLSGIETNVTQFDNVTPRQRQAIVNIRESVQRTAGKGWSRRYEGYSK